MDPDLWNLLQKAGVKEEVVGILEDEELDTEETLRGAPDDLLKTCGLKGGQILKIRRALVASEKVTQGEESITASAVVCSESPQQSQITPTSNCPSTSGSGHSSHSSIVEISDIKIPPPQPATSASSHASTFAIKEVTNKNKNWIKDYKLPESFSPPVKEALKAGHLSSALRDEFTRDICSSIKVNTLYPTRAEKDRVSFLILEKYPCLSDSLGAGLNSWTKAIGHRFKNIRRKRKDKSLPSKTVSKTPARSDDTIKPPAPKKQKVSGSIPLPVTETEETCLEHVKAMKKEMAKVSNRNKSLLKQLMQLTYAYRRNSLFHDAQQQTVKEFMETYPALQMVTELKAEFSRILEDNTGNVWKSGVENFKHTQEKVLRVAKKSTNKKVAVLLEKCQEEITDNSDKKTAIECCTTLLVIQQLLKEKTAQDDVILKICEEGESLQKAVEDSKYPRLVGSGDLFMPDPLVIAVEGSVALKLSNVPWPSAIILLLATFYVFNIEYAPGARNICALLESLILGRHEMAKKRITVQKFLKELEF